MEIKSSARRHGIADEELATWFEESSPEDYEIMIDGTAQALLFRAARMKKPAEEEAIKQGAFQHYKPLVDA